MEIKIKVSKELHRQFKVLCVQKGSNMQKELEQFIRDRIALVGGQREKG